MTEQAALAISGILTHKRRSHREKENRQNCSGGRGSDGETVDENKGNRIGENSRKSKGSEGNQKSERDEFASDESSHFQTAAPRFDVISLPPLLILGRRR